MSKPINNYLDSVIDLYKSFVNKGDIIPLEFNFAAFNVTKGIFNFYAVDALSERVRIGVDSGMYGLQKYSNDINYDELVDYSSRKKMGLTTPTEDKTTGLLIDTMIGEKVKKDSSITAMEARNGALLGSCVKTMDYKVQELINFEYFKPEIKSNKELRNENQANELLLGTKERVDFLATMVAMKEILPQIYKKVWESLSDREQWANDSVKAYTKNVSEDNQQKLESNVKQNMQISQLVKNLKDETVNPSAMVLQRAIEVDPGLKKNFIESYPKTMKEVMSYSSNGMKHSM